MASEHCTNPGIQTNHKPQGQFRNIAGNNVYETGASNHPVVFYLTDVYGNEVANSTNNHRLADIIASSGFHVYMPDLFKGSPMPTDDPDPFSKLPTFLTKHPADDVEREHIKESIVHVISEQTNGNRYIQFIGICYGAKPITVLLSDPRIASRTSAVVFNHPSLLTIHEADVWPSHVALHINESSDDEIFNGEVKEYWENTLSQKKVLSIKEYPGTKHSFSVRPINQAQLKGRDEAEKITIQFLKSHLQPLHSV